MFLSHKSRARLSVVAGLGVAAAAWLLTPAPAAAQQSADLPRIPPDARGYQTVMILQDYHRQRAAQRPAATPRPSAPAPLRTRAAPPAALVVSVTRPAEQPAAPTAAPLLVDIRGPDGTVRTFPVEGGRAAIQTQTVIVRPGETMTLRVLAAGPGK